MSKRYKYKITLATGENKEFECEYSPEQIRISHSILNNAYSLKANGNIIYGNVINYEFIESTGEITVEELEEGRGRFILCKLMGSFKIVLIILLLLALLKRLFNVNDIGNTTVLILLGIMWVGCVLKLFYDNKQFSKRIELYKNKEL